jgi:hypothetical protein
MNVILKKVSKWGSNFFFTFPTSEGSDLLSSHVMQTPTFISKLSDGNVIFRLDVGKTSLINKVGKKLKENGVKKVRNTLISRPFQGQVKVSQGIID